MFEFLNVFHFNNYPDVYFFIFVFISLSEHRCFIEIIQSKSVNPIVSFLPLFTIQHKQNEADESLH